MPRGQIRSWLMDTDGVLVHEEQAIPGANELLSRLRELDLPFRVLISNSDQPCATGVDPYFVGKPNPLMMRTALNTLDAHHRASRIVSVADIVDELG